MRLILCPNKNQHGTKDMVDLLTEDRNGNRAVYGTMHIDFLFDTNCDLHKRLYNNEEIEIVISEVK